MKDRFETFIKETTAIYRAVQRIKNMEMTELGLKGMHMMCVYFLYKNPGGLTAAQLSEMCCEDKAAISRAIATLREKGYVTEEQEGLPKKYRSAIMITDKGRELGVIESEKILNALDAGGMGLSDGKRSDFYSSLSVISENLNNYTEKLRNKRKG